MDLGPSKNYKLLITPDNEKSYAYQIVIYLVNNLPNNGHTLFFDSWYLSIKLGQEPIKKGFNFITNLKSNAIGLPDKNLLVKNSKHYAYDKNSNSYLIHQYEEKNS